MDPRCKGMPLSSFLLKPMQRVTRYPLIIKNVRIAHKHMGLRARGVRVTQQIHIFLSLLSQILENTPESHPDHSHLKAALEKAEELCSQVRISTTVFLCSGHLELL